jgi:hypothetical protein
MTPRPPVELVPAKFTRDRPGSARVISTPTFHRDGRFHFPFVGAVAEVLAIFSGRRVFA